MGPNRGQDRGQDWVLRMTERICAHSSVRMGKCKNARMCQRENIKVSMCECEEDEKVCEWESASV